MQAAPISLIAAITIAILSTPAMARDLCAQITQALGDPSNTRTVSHEPYLSSVPCTKGIALGGAPFTHCAWPFAFRSITATHAFDATVAAIANCPDAQTRLTVDQPVNHPDSYDLRQLQFPGGEVGISIKDKGALAQTYVFIRIQSVAPAK